MSPVLGLVLLAAKKFWILDPLYAVLGTVLAFFYDNLGHSFGVAIILLTLSVRLLTFPLTAKQARSQQELQRHQPEIKRLQAKYKGDKQKLNEEMMKFYKENKVNPFGGCLPLLVQFPVLIVLYRLILGLTHKPPKNIPTSSVMYRALVESGGRMMSWGMDLSRKASEVTGSTRLPFLLLVGAVVATGYYQQRQLSSRLPKDSQNSQMAVMGKVFPLIFGLISWSIPAGVVVYFLVSNLWQIGQQAYMFRNQPKPEPGPAAAAGKGKGAAPSGKGKGRPTPARGAKGAKGVVTTRGAKSAKGAPAAKQRGGSKGAVAKGGTAAAARGAKGPAAQGRRPGKGGPAGKPGKGAPPPTRAGKPAKGAGAVGGQKRPGELSGKPKSNVQGGGVAAPSPTPPGRLGTNGADAESSSRPVAETPPAVAVELPHQNGSGEPKAVTPAAPPAERPTPAPTSTTDGVTMPEPGAPAGPPDTDTDPAPPQAPAVADTKRDDE